MIIQKINYTDRDLLEFLGEQESQHVEWGNQYSEELLDHFLSRDGLTGARLPWSKTHDQFRLRPGEVTIWAGMNGHHKSMILGQIMQWLAWQDGERVGLMSFEMPIRDTMKRMCQQASGSLAPSEEYIRSWARWNDQRICYYDKLDTTPSERVLGAVFYMAKELGVTHIMIDSLTKCGLPYGERGAEKDFIDALCATAKHFQIHIHLVCHVRKPGNAGEEHIPTKFDVRGAGELTDLVHNVVICWTDKKKLQLKRRSQPLSDAEDKYLERPDQRLIVAKQRNGAYEGTIGLYLRDCLQFTGDDSSSLMHLGVAA